MQWRERAIRRPYASVPAHKTTERYLTLLLEVEPSVWMFVLDKKEPANILGSFLFLCEEKGLAVLVLVEMPNLEEPVESPCGHLHHAVVSNTPPVRLGDLMLERVILSGSI